MPALARTSMADQTEKLPSAVRPIVRAARRIVARVAPDAEEIAKRSSPPRSKSMMWKIARYAVDGEPVVGIGTFTAYAVLFFYRGRELADPGGLLEGGGKDSRFTRLRTAADADRPEIQRLVRRAFELARSGDVPARPSRRAMTRREPR